MDFINEITIGGGVLLGIIIALYINNKRKIRFQKGQVFSIFDVNTQKYKMLKVIYVHHKKVSTVVYPKPFERRPATIQMSALAERPEVLEQSSKKIRKLQPKLLGTVSVKEREITRYVTAIAS